MLFSLGNCKSCVPTVGNLSHFHPIYLKIVDKAFQNGLATAFSLQYSACLYIYFCMFSTAYCSIRVILVCELPSGVWQKGKLAGESRWVRPRGDKKVREPIEFVLMPPIHDTRFWYHVLIGQIADCWHMSYEYPWKNPHVRECYWSRSFQPLNPETTSSWLPWKLGH